MRQRPESGGASQNERIVGYDLARSFALFGMIVVHFSLVVAANNESPRWLAVILRFLDGRAAATFVMLAGIGIALITRKATESGDPARVAVLRKTLVKRGVFLLALGCVNLAIWPGDILRVYGVTFLLAAGFLRSSSRTLLAMAFGFGLGVRCPDPLFRLREELDWETMTYHNLWTVEGFLRNLLFDGFRSVFPWSGVLFAGMWLGRVNLSEPTMNGRVLAASLTTLLITEFVSWACISYFRKHPHGMDLETISALFRTESMPALPLFLSAAASTAIFVIALSIRVGQVGSLRKRLEPLAATGRMALTWYIAHIVLGLGAVVVTINESRHSLSVASASGLLFYGAAVVASWVWMQRLRYGPLEWIMRRICG